MSVLDLQSMTVDGAAEPTLAGAEGPRGSGLSVLLCDQTIEPRGSALSAVAMTFSERIARRHRLWWTQRRWGRVALHRLGERRTLRSRDDPYEAWRCCDLWQRTLLDKRNAREFAAKHGCRLPELYWCGSSTATPPLESLPPHFVIRPAFGANIRGVRAVTDGREIIWDEPASPADLRPKLPRSRRLGRGVPILIEEFIRDAEGAYRLPLEVKCHTFVDTVGAIEVTHRRGVNRARHRFYTADWTPIADPMQAVLREDEVLRPRPEGLDELLRLAAVMGAAFGSYVRIDFFASDRGWVFNEFSSVPFGGRKITPYCDRLFGDLWATSCPDAT